MSYSQVFRINSPTIIHEIIEGEAVIINMEMGHYYSIDQTGASPLPNAMMVTQKPSREVY